MKQYKQLCCSCNTGACALVRNNYIIFCIVKYVSYVGVFGYININNSLNTSCYIDAGWLSFNSPSGKINRQFENF